MSNANNSQQDDRLNQALSALQQSALPAGPSEELLQRTIARVGREPRMGAGEVLTTHTKEGWWTMKRVRRTILGTGLAAAAALALVWLLLGANSRLAFADVVERVKAVKILRCKITTEVEVTGRGKVTQHGDVIMSQNWMIEHIGTMKMIFDTAKGQLITLSDTPKQALVVKQENAPAAAQSLNLLDSFAKFDSQTSKPLPDMPIDGKSARGFEITQGGRHMKVWADPKTELPVRIEAAVEMMTGTTVVFTEFEWDPTVTPDEISLEIPKDYPVVNFNMDASKPSEGDVPKMLKSWVELNDGKFPENLAYTDMIQLLAKKKAQQMPAQTAGMTPEQKSQWIQKMSGEMMTSIAPVARGLSFVADPANGSDWYYAGATAKVGAKGQPLLWYKPAQGSGWRVLDADFTVHDAKDAPPGGQLIKKESLSLTPPSATLPAQTRPNLP